MSDLYVKIVDQQDPRLGRQCVQDPESRRFASTSTIDKTLWRSKTLRTYDPRINPNQCHGECTGVEKASHFNSKGFRKSGRILDMRTAHEIYSLATTLDPWAGSWPPSDTGSSGLAAAKAARILGYGGEYRWEFRGADGVVQSIMEDEDVAIGTWWTDGMFDRKPVKGGGASAWVIEPTGPRVGGHQYRARGYDLRRDLILIRCWWGDYKDVWIRRDHLNDLLMDDGDAHVQQAA